MSKSLLNNLILDLSTSPPIVFNRIHRVIMGNTSGGLLLAYLLYAIGAKSYQKTWRTDKKIKKDTGLTRWELAEAKTKLKELPFMRVERRGVPPKTYYRLERGQFFKYVREFTNKQDSAQLKDRPSKSSTPVIGKDREPGIQSAGNRSFHGNGSPLQRKGATLLPYKKLHGRKGDPIKNHRRWKIWSIKLAKAIAKGQGKKWNGLPAKGWDEFRKLHQIEKVPVSELREMVQWYCHKASEQNFLFLGRDQYIPVCGNGYSFRKKWDSLQGAKAKDQNWEYHKPTKKRKFNVVSQTVIKNK